jgi:hypothetical protein
MNIVTFLMAAEKIGIDRAIALSAVKWYSRAVHEDGGEVLALLYELSSYYDNITCCKRLKMHALNRLERGKPSADIETLKDIVDAIIEMNGNEGRTEKSKGCDSIQAMYEDGKDIAYVGHGVKSEEMMIFDKMIFYIKRHNIDFCDAVIDSREAIGQKNRREIKKHIDNMIDAVGCRDLNLHITADMFCKMSQLALHGYLAA